MAGILVHEWLARTGGSENVFESISEIFPDAERWALWDESGGRFTGINETLIAQTLLKGRKALALPAMPFAWRRLPERRADWVLISSHLFAHHARFGGPARNATKFVYAHTPARYVWVPELDGRGSGLAARAVSSVLKPLDRRRASEIHAIAANSHFVAKRIADTWEREAVVIHPPVEIETFGLEPDLTPGQAEAMSALPSEYLLGVSRFVPYKRLDLVIEAGRVTGFPVVLAGSGPDEGRLRALAAERHPGKVTFVAHPEFAHLRALYRAAAVVVFPPVEDFGIIPVEAMASGTPVVANRIGGASESVAEGLTGALVDVWTGSELRDAVTAAVGMSPADAVAQAQRFSTTRFKAEIVDWMHSNGANVTRSNA